MLEFLIIWISTGLFISIVTHILINTNKGLKAYLKHESENILKEPISEEDFEKTLLWADIIRVLTGPIGLPAFLLMIFNLFIRPR